MVGGYFIFVNNLWGGCHSRMGLYWVKGSLGARVRVVELVV